VKASRPAPEPSGEYCTVASGLASWKPFCHAVMAACCEDAPIPVSVPETPEPAAVSAESEAWPVALSEPHAVSASEPMARTAAERPRWETFT
jgi:hypothetical protein